jgi:O-antigen/teichoic acid export membrane protein
MTTTIQQTTIEDTSRDAKKVAKGAGISFIGSAMGRGFWFLCQVILARFLGPEIFGVYVLGLTVLKITELFTRLGLHAGALRYISMYRKEDPGQVKGVIISAPLITFLNGILIGGIVYYFASFIATAIFHKPELTNVIKTFAFCTPFMAAMNVIANASLGFHTAKYLVYIKDIIQPSVNLVLVILFIKLGLDISWIIGAFVISHVIALVPGIYFISGQFSRISKEYVKPVFKTRELLSYSVPLLFSVFLAFLLKWTDIMMLGFMKTNTEVAIYRVAAQIPVFFVLFLNASNTIYAPAIAEMYHAGQMRRLENIYKTITRWLFQIVLPISLVIIFSAREVISVFGAGYIDTGYRVLAVLTIAQFINCITGGVSYTLSMTGKQNALFIYSLAMAIINIVLNYLLIPLYGSYGAAIATGISIATFNLLKLLQVYFYYKIHPYNLQYLQGIICGILSIAVLYLLNNYALTKDYLLINNLLLKHQSMIRLVSNSIVVGVIFTAGFIIKGITDEDKYIFDAFAKKFKFKMRVSRA